MYARLITYHLAFGIVQTCGGTYTQVVQAETPQQEE